MKTKTSILACVAIMLTLALSACGGGQGANNPQGGSFTIEEIQGAPANYVGNITLVGVVGASSTQDFALLNAAGTFHIQVDYRGSQALPQIGDKVAVEGQLTENRPCCGPGFTLTSTQFEEVAQ